VLFSFENIVQKHFFFQDFSCRAGEFSFGPDTFGLYPARMTGNNFWLSLGLSNKWSNIRFGEEIGILEINILTLSGALDLSECFIVFVTCACFIEQMIMMCGLPASGKSTWAEKFVNEHPEAKFNLLGTNLIIDKMKVRPNILQLQLAYGQSLHFRM